MNCKNNINIIYLVIGIVSVISICTSSVLGVKLSKASSIHKLLAARSNYNNNNNNNNEHFRFMSKTMNGLWRIKGERML